MISIHPSALVASRQIGDRTRIWAFVNILILAGARISAGCNICDRCFIENYVAIGDRVTVKCGVSGPVFGPPEGDDHAERRPGDRGTGGKG